MSATAPAPATQLPVDARTLEAVKKAPTGTVVAGPDWAAVKHLAEGHPGPVWSVTGQPGLWRDLEVARMMDADRRRKVRVRVVRP